MYSIIRRTITSTGQTNCPYYEEFHQVKNDFIVFTQTYLNPRWTEARNDEACVRTRLPRTVYQNIIAMIQKSQDIRTATNKLSSLLEIPYFVVRSTLRDCFWNSDYFQHVLANTDRSYLQLCFILGEVNEAVRLFERTEYLPQYDGLTNHTLCRPCCVRLNRFTSHLLQEASDKTIFLLDRSHRVIEVFPSVYDACYKYFDYLRDRPTKIRTCWSWIFCSRDEQLTVAEPALILSQMAGSDNVDNSQQLVSLAHRYLESSSEISRTSIMHSLIADFLPKSVDVSKNVLYQGGSSLNPALRVALSSFDPSHHTIDPIIERNSGYELVLHHLNPDRLVRFIIDASRTQGYDYAVSFVVPLIYANKVRINPKFYLYFLSEAIHHIRGDARSCVQDYHERVLSKVASFSRPDSTLHQEFRSICRRVRYPSQRLFTERAEEILPVPRCEKTHIERSEEILTDSESPSVTEKIPLVPSTPIVVVDQDSSEEEIELDDVTE